MSTKRICLIPSPMTINGRSSSITNAFVNAIIPVIKPTHEEEVEAMEILGMTADDVRCAYCGDKATEWDHLRPLVTNQRPTGYITEIANLVPSCGKCNQSKGKSDWSTWMLSNAPLSPATRGISRLDERIQRLQSYERWKRPIRIDFTAVVGTDMWRRHRANWESVLSLLNESQKLAAEIRDIVGRSVNALPRSAGKSAGC